MITENLSTLKIHKLTQAQYDRELAAGNIDPNALYLTPDEEIDLSQYATVEQLNNKANAEHTHDISDIENLQSSLDEMLEESKEYTDTSVSGKADIGHNHDDRYYTEDEIDTKLITKASIDHNHDSNYDAIGSADTALASAKEYTNTKTANLASTSTVDTKISSHNTSTSAHNDIRVLISDLTTKLNNFLDVDDTTTDQLSEVITLINNNKGTLESLTTSKVNVTDIVNNLTTNVSNKPLSAAQGVAIKALIDALDEELDSHSHAISDVTGLQSALDEKAASSHGTHVSYSTTNPVMDGTASAGSASTVARSDHKHPTDTSRASKTEFDTHTSNITVHITSTERSNWNTAKTHADSAHAPSNAEKNQNAFSNIKVGSTTVAADTTTDTVEFVGSNVTITPDATNDKVTFAVADGSTNGKGIVQLTNSTSSTSTTTAATPNSVKSAYDLANTAKTNAATAQTRADSAYSLAEGKADSLSDLGVTATATELNYVDGVTSNIQTQLDGKSNTSHTHNNYASTVTTTGSGNAITAISQSGNTITATKGATFLTAHPSRGSVSTYEYTKTTEEGDVIEYLTAVGTDSYGHVTSYTSYKTTLPKITGAISPLVNAYLTGRRVLISDAAGSVDVSDVTTTELGYLTGVTSNVQTQLNTIASKYIADITYPSCYYRTVDGVTEWINPPMVFGTEYRTTERFNGKVVYTKAVNWGALPNTEMKTYDLPNASITKIVDFRVFAHKEDTNVFNPFPWIGDNGTAVGKTAVSTSSAYVKTFSNLSVHNAYAIFKYTID